MLNNLFREISLKQLGLFVVAWIGITISDAANAKDGATANSSNKLPNIIVILADDFGYGSTNAYGAPESLVQTPNINRLAKEGKRFTQAYTGSSVCSPTRYGLLTGQYAFRTSLTKGVLNTFAPLHINTKQPNLASLLQKKGYETAAIGKWHLGYGNARSSDGRTDYTAKLSPGPLEIGFNYHFGVPSNHGDLTGVFVENHYVYGLKKGKIAEGDKVGSPAEDDDNFQAAYSAEDTQSKRLNGIEVDAPRRKNDRVMAVLNEKVGAWLDQQKADKPFFLYYTPVAVHNPTTPSKDTTGSSAAGIYGDWIHELDRSVGALLDKLDKSGLAENTVVLFSSDNGGVYRPFNEELVQTKALRAGLKVNGELRGGKHTVFEGGFRVPYIVRWPNHIASGSTSDEVVSLVDTFATISSLVGEPLPPANAAAQDSYDVLPAWTGDDPNLGIRRDLIVHSADGVFAIRKGPWKWIEGVPAEGLNQDSNNRKDNFAPQLYNLQVDPSESKDVSNENPQVVEELKSLLVRYRRGGYSRELPPEVSVETPKGLTLKAPIEKLPEAPWSVVRGKWSIEDGALFGAVEGRQAAALSVPAPKGDTAIKYEVKLGDVQRQTIRIDLSEGRSIRLDATSSGLQIIKNDSDGAQGPDKQETWATVDAKFDTTAWIPIEVKIVGDKVQFQSGETAIEAVNGLVKESRNTISWVIIGGTAGLRNLSVE